MGRKIFPLSGARLPNGHPVGWEHELSAHVRLDAGHLTGPHALGGTDGGDHGVPTRHRVPEPLREPVHPRLQRSPVVPPTPLHQVPAVTLERLRHLYLSGWRFEMKYTKDNELDELVYRKGPCVLRVRGPDDASLVIAGREHTGTLHDLLSLF